MAVEAALEAHREQGTIVYGILGTRASDCSAGRGLSLPAACPPYAEGEQLFL